MPSTSLSHDFMSRTLITGTLRIQAKNRVVVANVNLAELFWANLRKLSSHRSNRSVDVSYGDVMYASVNARVTDSHRRGAGGARNVANSPMVTGFTRV